MGHIGPNQVAHIVETDPVAAHQMLLTPESRAAKEAEMATQEWQTAHPEQAKRAGLGATAVAPEIAPTEQ